MDQVPMLRAAAARASIQIREFSEIFRKLSMFEFELKSCGRHQPFAQNMQTHPPGNPDSSEIVRVIGVCMTRRWRKQDSNLYGAFPVKSFFELLSVLCSERESRSSSRRLRSGSRSARKGSRDRNGSKAWRLAA